MSAEYISTKYGILIICSLLGLILIRMSWRSLHKKQFIRSSIKFSAALSFLLIATIFGSFIIDNEIYQRLTREHAVASIEFHTLGKHHYQAKLTEANNKPRFLEIHGDQWQLDARILKWQGAAEWSGLKPLYRLERIGGRYQNITMEMNSTRSLYALTKSSEQGFHADFWDFLIDYQAYIPWLDAYYGNATYLPMSHGAKFTIQINASGLIARPENEPARNSLKHWRVDTNSSSG